MLTCSVAMKRKRDLSCDSESNGIKEEEEEESNGVEGPLAILWDIENCCVPTYFKTFPNIVVDNIRNYLRGQGIKAPITFFSAYGDFRRGPPSWKESCQENGVNLINVPHNREDAADKAILLDMLWFAMENPPPSSILLISGDGDFARALYRLGQRGHSILVAADLSLASKVLLGPAKFVWEWHEMASNGNLQSENQTLCGRFEPQFLPNVADNYSETIRESNPELSLQVSKRPKNSRFFVETRSKGTPASEMQLRELKQRGIDVVKKGILSLLHRTEGCITIGKIPTLYRNTFEKTLDRKTCGFKLHKLLKKMEDVHVRGQGNTACVYLISQGKCLCQQSNMNSDAPNHKNVTEAGGGSPSETEIESNQTHMMQPSKIEAGDCGLPSQITTKPESNSSVQPSNISPSVSGLPYETTKSESTSSLQPTTNRPSDLDNVEKELLTLLSTYESGIRLTKIASKYEQTFKKRLCVKDDYGCDLRTLLNRIGNGIYIQGMRAFFRPQGSEKRE